MEVAHHKWVWWVHGKYSHSGLLACQQLFWQLQRQQPRSPSGASLSGDDQGVGCGGGLQSWGGREKAAESTYWTNHAADSGGPSLGSWAKKRQQGNVAHPADVSLALRHKPDSNGPVCGEGCGCGLWLAMDRLRVADL
jgi:hypothetical protein